MAIEMVDRRRESWVWRLVEMGGRLAKVWSKVGWLMTSPSYGVGGGGRVGGVEQRTGWTATDTDTQQAISCLVSDVT